MTGTVITDCGIMLTPTGNGQSTNRWQKKFARGAKFLTKSQKRRKGKKVHTWSDGAVEEWSGGVVPLHHSNTPSFHYSITPFVFLCLSSFSIRGRNTLGPSGSVDWSRVTTGSI